MQELVRFAVKQAESLGADDVDHDAGDMQADRSHLSYGRPVVPLRHSDVHSCEVIHIY